MRARWVPLTTTLLLLAPACGGDDSTAVPTTAAPTSTAAPATSSTTTTVPAATTTTTNAADEEAAVIAAYLAYWDTLLIITNPGQPDSPLIEQVATGPAADRLRQIAAERVELNEAWRLPENSQYRRDPEILQLEDAEAVVGDCVVDDGYRVNLGTGAMSDDAVATQLWRVTMSKATDGDWRVDTTQMLTRWDGVAGCAID